MVLALAARRAARTPLIRPAPDPSTEGQGARLVPSEKGPDPMTQPAPKRRPGRPRGTKTGPHKPPTVMMQFRSLPEEVDAFKAACADRTTTASAVLREAMKKYSKK